jgi:peroxiredoxin
MLWTRLREIALKSAIVLAIGAGAGVSVRLSLAAQDAGERTAANSASSGARVPKPPTAAEQYRGLVKDYNDAMAALGKLVEKARTEAERQTIYKDHGLPEKEFNPRFLALAERYPNDSAAVDALVWIIEKTVRYSAVNDRGTAASVDRAVKILIRNHLGDPRLGPLCLKLVLYPAPSRDALLRTVAEKSPDRAVRGRATLALALYLKNKGAFVRDLKKPEMRTDNEFLRAMYGADYLAQLRAADPGSILREADQLVARVANEYGAIAYTPASGQPTRESLADVARREGKQGPVADPDEQFRTLDDAFRAAIKAADRAATEAQKTARKSEPGEENVRAYIAAYPRWNDHGMKMWRLAQDAPRHPAAFNALIWLVEQGPRFFDAQTERDATMSEVVDALIRDHLETIAEHLTDRNVALALNMGEQLPAPYRERLLRALHERCRDRPTRGRMGLALGRYLKATADCIARLSRSAADSRRAWDVYFLEPGFLAKLRNADRAAIEGMAAETLSRVIADYGDIPYLNGMVTTEETLAVVAERELSEIRKLAVGKQAPEIKGEDVDGKPMTLSQFRGKVVLLDFGSHEHCSGCVLVYPRLRSTLERLRGRPFVILGINNHDRRDALKQAVSRGEITWRAWWDGDSPSSPGPITTSWNIRGYPTFFLIDHLGVVRSKADLHPLDTPSFEAAVEDLVKQAER